MKGMHLSFSAIGIYLLFFMLLPDFLPAGRFSTLRLYRESSSGASISDTTKSSQNQAIASELLERFKSYWERSDVDGLLSLLSERGKVIMKVGFLNLDGEYGRSQAKTVMKEFFEGGSKRRFSISRYRELSGGISAYAAGTIHFVDEKFGLDRTLKIFISMEESGGRWSVEEFRISDK